MNRYILTLFLLLALWQGNALAQQGFEQDFCDSTLRIDYIISGNIKEQTIAVDGLSRMPGWYGKRKHLTEIPVHGAATITMTRVADGKVIFVNTFSTLFQEWLELDDSHHHSKAFECVQPVPMPCDSVTITTTLFNNRHEAIASITHAVSPRDCTIRHLGEKNVSPHVTILEPDDPGCAINVAFIAEGYTQAQMEDFLSDCRKATDGIFSFEPFKSSKGKFRITAVLTPSLQAGPSIPSENVWNTTAVGASFDTFGMERYLTTLRIKQMHDALAGTPYDHIIVLVNTDRYGGGGIYNNLNLLMTKHRLFIEVLVHEFGHSFAGLADEYAYPEEEPNDFPLDVEPWAPNVTTLANFDSKWSNMLSDDASRTVKVTDDSNLDTRSLGLYEGAANVVKGVYRPCPNCMMRTLKVPTFCPVCTQAITRIINFYTQ